MEDIENILKNIDGDWLTDILEPYAEEFLDEIILLDITKKDLSNKNYDNIHQVGYRAPYGDEGEINGLIYFYYKKMNTHNLQKNMLSEAKVLSLFIN